METNLYSRYHVQGDREWRRYGVRERVFPVFYRFLESGHCSISHEKRLGHRILTDPDRPIPVKIDFGECDPGFDPGL